MNEVSTIGNWCFGLWLLYSSFTVAVISELLGNFLVCFSQRNTAIPRVELNRLFGVDITAILIDDCLNILSYFHRSS